MATIAPSVYRPAVAIPPGETILEMLQDKGMTQTEFAERMGRPLNKLNEIINGKRAITPDTACSLELVLGLTAQFWLNLETNYQLALKRLEARKRLEEEAKFLGLFPFKEMIKRGWMKAGRDAVETTQNLLAYFRIASFEQLTSPSVLGAAFRKSQVREACDYSLAAWLRRGEIEAERIQTGPFNKSALRESIAEMRSLTLLGPEQFEPRLVGLCAAHGVAVVFVPHLPKCYTSGAARWIGDKAIIQLSLRFATNDHFWFSFFHELGHIVLHGKSSTFIEKHEDSVSAREQEANEFSARCLIQPADFERLRGLNYKRSDVIRDFAASIGIAPGIVVGQLQHANLLDHNLMFSLKVKFAWGPGERGD